MFVFKAIKEKKHQKSIIEALEQIITNQDNIQNLWAYGCKILNIQSGNYNYEDHVAEDRKRKEQEKVDIKQIKEINLLKEIKSNNKPNKSIEEQRKELIEKFGK